MPGKTIAEKILGAKSGRDARAGDVVVCPVDAALGTDGSTPMAIDYFEAMQGTRVVEPGRLIFALDHYAPGSAGMAQLHDRIRAFARAHGIPLSGLGEGIGLHLMVESGRVVPGSLVVGADSHSVMLGALNAFSTGIGSSDLAAVMICGRVWLKVPETIRVVLEGRLGPGVYPKDIALALTATLGAEGANYLCLEFAGDGVATLALEDRLVISNLVVEMGAKAGVFPGDAATADYLAGRTSVAWEAVAPDEDAVYAAELRLDLSTLEPRLALPHNPDNGADLGSAEGTAIDMVFLGTCIGGRARDLQQATRVLEVGGGIAPGVCVVVTPASKQVYLELAADGTLARLVSLGAVLTTPGCGACCGTSGVVPGDGMTVISTANRNFKGRMGNPSARIYLASPAACAAAAVTGRITDPRRFEA